MSKLTEIVEQMAKAIVDHPKKKLKQKKLKEKK